MILHFMAMTRSTPPGTTRGSAGCEVFGGLCGPHRHPARCLGKAQGHQGRAERERRGLRLDGTEDTEGESDGGPFYPRGTSGKRLHHYGKSPFFLGENSLP